MAKKKPAAVDIEHRLTRLEVWLSILAVLTAANNPKVQLLLSLLGR